MICLIRKKKKEIKINWKKVKEVRNILFEFYKREMLLQQDDANSINLSQCWESLERLIEATTIEEEKATEFAVFAKSLVVFVQLPFEYVF